MRAGVTLGLDTATRATVVGLRADDVRAEATDDPPAGQRPRHATALLPLAARLLEDAGMGWPDVATIAVGLGPGSFTGLRIGVASARALAQSTGSALHGVSTLRALARPAQEAAPGRRVLAVVDGGRGEVFAAGWDGGDEVIAAHATPADRLPALVRTAGGDWVAVESPPAPSVASWRTRESRCPRTLRGCIASAAWRSVTWSPRSRGATMWFRTTCACPTRS